MSLTSTKLTPTPAGVLTMSGATMSMKRIFNNTWCARGGDGSRTCVRLVDSGDVYVDTLAPLAPYAIAPHMGEPEPLVPCLRAEDATDMPVHTLNPWWYCLASSAGMDPQMRAQLCPCTDSNGFLQLNGGLYVIMWLNRGTVAGTGLYRMRMFEYKGDPAITSGNLCNRGMKRHQIVSVRGQNASWSQSRTIAGACVFLVYARPQTSVGAYGNVATYLVDFSLAKGKITRTRLDDGAPGVVDPSRLTDVRFDVITRLRAAPVLRETAGTRVRYYVIRHGIEYVSCNDIVECGSNDKLLSYKHELVRTRCSDGTVVCEVKRRTRLQVVAPTDAAVSASTPTCASTATDTDAWEGGRGVRMPADVPTDASAHQRVVWRQSAE